MWFISIGIISAFFTPVFLDLAIPGTHQKLSKNKEGWMDNGQVDGGCLDDG